MFRWISHFSRRSINLGGRLLRFGETDHSLTDDVIELLKVNAITSRTLFADFVWSDPTSLREDMKRLYEAYNYLWEHFWKVGDVPEELADRLESTFMVLAGIWKRPKLILMSTGNSIYDRIAAVHAWMGVSATLCKRSDIEYITDRLSQLR